MYRIQENYQFDRDLAAHGMSPSSEENCRQWQLFTSNDIPLQDIYQIVYEMPLDEFEKVYDARNLTYSNSFTEWITKKDTAILDFLLLAKTNEYIRKQRNSRWYYPSMKIGARMTIEEIAEKALSVKNRRLGDRYLLQAIRALFTLGRYESCIELWESEVSELPENNLMRRMILPYIAGAEFRVNRLEKAMEYFAKIGDVGSIIFCADRESEYLTTVDALEMVCKYNPNSPGITESLQAYVRGLEPTSGFWYGERFESKDKPYVDNLYALCMKMIRDGKSDNPAMWYYTAAFLSDLKEDTDQASHLLELAKMSNPNVLMAESIAVMEMYLDAKLSTYNKAYENRLLKQLKWLDKMIVSKMDDRVRHETAQGDKLVSGESYYYWNDMLRRILLAEVCPRMIRAGKAVRALQLANMADNRMLGLVDKQEFGHYEVESYTMKEYRYSENFNRYDYSNHFFEMIDSLGVKTAKAYLSSVINPKTEFDRFLNERSYVGSDYLNDIVGTQCLRNMMYGEAVKYLAAVSKAYKSHLNVSAPHELDAEDFRFNFARQMYSLEQCIELDPEPNRKAELIGEYAYGIRISFDTCWALTQYYKGDCYWGQVCEKRDWENDCLTKAAFEKAGKLEKLAFGLATDDAVAAKIHYKLGHYKTVAQKYFNTKWAVGCDNLSDYLE